MKIISINDHHNRVRKSLHLEVWSGFILDIVKPHRATESVVAKHANDLGRELAIWLAAIFGVILGVYLFLRGFKLLARKRLIQNIPASKIRSASLGEVEISGKAAGPYTIISPLSQTECFYYKATIGDATNDAESLCVPFFVRDETGHVMVDLRGAECQLPATFEEQNHVYDLGECAQHFAARHGFTPGALVRVSEYCLQVNDPLFVLGTLAENSGNRMGPGFPTVDGSMEADFLSAEAAAAQRAVMLEMMTVPIAPTKTSTSEAVQDPTFDLSPPVILRKGAGKTPFVVSRRSVKQVVEELTAKSSLYIWGGPFLVLASVAVLLTKLRLW